MKQVCRDCEFSKPKTQDYCYCVKYGIMMRYGRIYCVSYEKRREANEAGNRTYSGSSGADRGK